MTGINLIFPFVLHKYKHRVVEEVTQQAGHSFLPMFSFTFPTSLQVIGEEKGELKVGRSV